MRNMKPVIEMAKAAHYDRDFWDSKFPVEQLPADAEEFDQRFALLGLSVKECINNASN